ncbi:DUF2336 domain-containing protein [Xanthobacteraceae bacterium Astr-EGSB]|uniref:DUF2336 domain-containing protein n=1 Tax=Astrobacterium formosum TaxID=3069710 RepID=UPI0027AE1EE7|nr:DUF2336 domain-containing protein [Xanthobacteraceae bacterium Astr-EGSB]
MGDPALLADIEGTIASRSTAGRSDTLRKVTDLFVDGADRYNAQQVALFDDVIGRLADSTDQAAKAELSERLAVVDNAPANVVGRLAADDAIEVARPVLAQSGRLTESQLADLAATKGRGHMLAIAGRTTLGTATTDALIHRGDMQVIRTVAGNAGAEVSEAGYGSLIDHAASDPRLAECVALRPDIPAKHFRTLIAIAPEAVQQRLASTNPRLAERIRQVMAEVAQEKAHAVQRDYTLALQAVGSLAKAGGLNDETVAEFAKAGQFEESVVSLAALGHLGIEAAARLLTSEPTDTLLIVVRAVDLSWPTARALMLLRPSGHNAPQDIEDANTNFIRLSPVTAKQGLKFYKQRIGHTSA